MANNTFSNPQPDEISGLSLAFTIFFSVCTVFNILWIIHISRTMRKIVNDSLSLIIDIERQSLLATTTTPCDMQLPKSGNTAPKNVVPAKATIPALVKIVLGLLIFALCLAGTGLVMSIILMVDHNNPSVMSTLRWPAALFHLLFLGAATAVQFCPPGIKGMPITAE